MSSLKTPRGRKIPRGVLASERNRAAIVPLLLESGGDTVYGLSAKTGIPVSSIRATLRGMENSGEVWGTHCARIKGRPTLWCLT